MANDTFPHNLPGKSLEITLQDSLDSLEGFTLQVTYATINTQFEILSVNDATNSGNHLPAKPTRFTLVTTAIINNPFQPTIRRQQRV